MYLDRAQMTSEDCPTPMGPLHDYCGHTMLYDDGYFVLQWRSVR